MESGMEESGGLTMEEFQRKRIFLAGSIEPGDWREAIVKPELLRITDADIATMENNQDYALPVRRRAVFGVMDYLGPYIVPGKAVRTVGKYAYVANIAQADVIAAYIHSQVDAALVYQLGIAAGAEIATIISVEPARDVPDILTEAVADAHSIFECTDPASFLREELSILGLLSESPIEAMFSDAARGSRFLFQAQWPVGKYRLDFAMPAQKVAIELDGHEAHKTKQQRTHDAVRDRYLTEQGWTVLRFTGSEVFKDAKGCVEQVERIVEGE